jgi:hypothetical protein
MLELSMDDWCLMKIDEMSVKASSHCRANRFMPFGTEYVVCRRLVFDGFVYVAVKMPCLAS